MSASRDLALLPDAKLASADSPAKVAHNEGHTGDLAVSGRMSSRSPFVARTGVSLPGLAEKGKAAESAGELDLLPLATAVIAARISASATANFVEFVILRAFHGLM